jgi:hypothetical protein
MSSRRFVAAVAAMLSLAAAAFAIPSAASADAATACVTGGVTYVDQKAMTRPSVNLGVQVWDRDDAPNPDDLLKAGVTGADGRYKLCFDNDDAYRGQDVYVKLITENDRWKVQHKYGQLYEFRVEGPNNLADGSTFDFATKQPPSTMMRAWHAFDEANDAWKLVPHGANNCWPTKAGANGCFQLVIEWSPGVVIPIPYYNGKVVLSEDTPDNRSAVVHEIGHFVMHSAYRDDYNSLEDCPNLSHAPDQTSNVGCAWSEGFADWFAVATYQDPKFRQADGTDVDFEAATYGNGWDVGDKTEGRVAGALLDLSDYTNEQPYDRFGEGAGPILNTLTYAVSHSFKEFWNSHGLSSSQARASLYQNTIDYGFRDPLADYGELTRNFNTLGMPFPSPHNYRYNSNTNYWSVVATRPQNGVNVDLTLYDLTNLTTTLATSNSGGSAIDFVAVDSNSYRRKVGDDYYPQVNLVSAFDPDLTGYRIELAQGADQVKAGFQPVTMQPADVVAVRDVYLRAGTPTRITVTPASSNQNPAIFLMGDNPDNSATWVQGRGSAVASSNTAGAGQAESITYNPPRDGWYGFVMLNGPNGDLLDGGSGTYTVLREDLAPTGAAPATGAAAPADRQKPPSAEGAQG